MLPFCKYSSNWRKTSQRQLIAEILLPHLKLLTTDNLIRIDEEEMVKIWEAPLIHRAYYRNIPAKTMLYINRVLELTSNLHLRIEIMHGSCRNVDENIYEFIELFTFCGEYIRRRMLGSRFINESILEFKIKTDQLHTIFLNYAKMMQQAHKDAGIECKSIKNCVAKFFLHEDDFPGYTALERHLEMKQLIKNAKNRQDGFTATKLQGKIVYMNTSNRYIVVTMLKSKKKRKGEFVITEKPVTYHKLYNKIVPG
uniref:Uncharacterized protein n=1 Tax=Acrobeloides nanus TaxID=290746 RepID=A0A914D7P3_9BILA